MPVLTENPHAGSFLLSLDSSGNLSRDAITIVSGSGVLLPGAVLGKVTATGKFAPHDAAASNGAQNAAAILFDRVDATSADANGVGVVRHAEVRREALIWKSGASAAQIAAGLAALSSQMVVAR